MRKLIIIFLGIFWFLINSCSYTSDRYKVLQDVNYKKEYIEVRNYIDSIGHLGYNTDSKMFYTTWYKYIYDTIIDTNNIVKINTDIFDIYKKVNIYSSKKIVSIEDAVNMKCREKIKADSIMQILNTLENIKCKKNGFDQ